MFQNNVGLGLSLIQRYFLFLLLALGGGLLSSSTKSQAGELVLAKDGKTEYSIVIPKGTPRWGFAATARDMARILEEATGAAFPVAEEGAETTQKKIYLGATVFAADNGVEQRALGGSGWLIKTAGENLVIVGGRDTKGEDNRFGIHEFLEKHVGCLWLDETTEIIPRHPVLKISLLDEQGKTAFDTTSIGTVLYRIFDNDPIKTHRSGLFLGRNKYHYGERHGSPGSCHTFYNYSKEWQFKPEVHPEYYSFSNGKRNLPKYDGSADDNMYGHLCLSNSEVSKLLLEQLRAFIAKDRKKTEEQNLPLPERWIYDISQNDPGGKLCECPECMALFEREGSTDTALLLHALNPVAETIAKDFPDIIVQTFAYKHGIRPPHTLRPAANLRIRLADLGREWSKNDKFAARDQLFPLTHPINEASYNNFLGWSKISNHLAIWGYWGIYLENFQSPYVMTHCIQPDLIAYRDGKVEYIYIELDSKVDMTSFFALTRWLGYKLMQNPDQPRELLLEKFMKGYYGPAAPIMREYLDYLEKSILAVNAPLNEIPVDERPYLKLEFFTKVQAMLDRAEAACNTYTENLPYLFHVKRERVPVDCAHLHLWPKLVKQVSAGEFINFNRNDILGRYKINRMEQARAMFSATHYARVEPEILKEFRELDPEEQAKTEKLKALPPPALAVMKAAANFDGDPEKVDWEAVPVQAMAEIVTGLPTAEAPEFRAACDGDFLYVRLVDKKANDLQTGSDPWGGDDWEIFLARENSGAYRQWAIDPKGKCVALSYRFEDGKKITERLPEADCKAVSVCEKHVWTVSVAIPLSALSAGEEEKTKTLFANFFRNRKASKEMLGWSPTFAKHMHVMRRAGTLALTNDK
jgi:hypothetical protein